MSSSRSQSQANQSSSTQDYRVAADNGAISVGAGATLVQNDLSADIIEMAFDATGSLAMAGQRQTEATARVLESSSEAAFLTAQRQTEATAGALGDAASEAFLSAQRQTEAAARAIGEAAGSANDVAQSAILSGQRSAESISRTAEALGSGAFLAAQRQTEAATRAVVEAASSGNDVAGAAILANQRTSEAALRSSADSIEATALALTNNTGRALDLAGEVTDRALMSGERNFSTASGLIGDAFARQSDLVEQVIAASAAGSRDAYRIADSMTERATTAISDSRRDTNETVLTNAFKYGAIGVGALAIGLAIFAALRK